MKNGTLIVIVSIILLNIVACSETSWDTHEQDMMYEKDETLVKNQLKKKQKCPVCHFKESQGTYKRLDISCNAQGSHINHGDGLIGEPVPDMEGYIFGEDCEFIQTLEECPCFTMDDLVDLGGWIGYCQGEQGYLIASRGQLAFQDMVLNGCEFHARGININQSSMSSGASTTCAEILQEFIDLYGPGLSNNPSDQRCNL